MDPHHHEPCWLIVLGRSGPGDCQDQSSDIRGCTSVLPRSEEEATARSGDQHRSGGIVGAQLQCEMHGCKPIAPL
ncbi:hypothetical protein Y1Q_0000578 [Alligator mississippiensis]|uniref:Uncharacterized protein n=1 Tax=Alligator mississippiensis TaxID=8496 RepID=A0A151MBL1_ALLMI|nr:hypothetical protein Y1Q_0000578 [Alligator mississippiensis]